MRDLRGENISSIEKNFVGGGGAIIKGVASLDGIIVILIIAMASVNINFCLDEGPFIKLLILT